MTTANEHECRVCKKPLWWCGHHLDMKEFEKALFLRSLKAAQEEEARRWA